MKRRIRFSSLLVLALCVLGQPGLAQEEEPNRATGIREGALYSSSGSDDINLFSGNLVYSIPVGEPIRVGPLLSIGPTLVYNSQASRLFWVCKDALDFPTGDRAIGEGWRLHFGRLVPVRAGIPHGTTVCQPLVASAGSTPPPLAGMISKQWGYEGPDGSVHEFFDRLNEATCNVSDPTCETTHPPDCFDPAAHGAGHCFAYSHDGSYLRLDPIDPEHGGRPTVYFPDGTYRVLGFYAGRSPVPGISTATDLYYADRSPVYNTTIVGDTFGNQYTVQYYGDGTPGSPAHPLSARGVPENQRDVLPYRAFESSPASPFVPLNPNAVFAFDVDSYQYSPDPLYPPVWAPRLWRIVVPTSASNGAGGWQTGAWILGSQVPRLDSLQLPILPGQAAMNYTFSYTPEGLASVTLPSEGRIEYTYGDIVHWTRQSSFWAEENLQDRGFKKDLSKGVAERRTYRQVKQGIGMSPGLEESRTTYVRSYRVEDACSESSLEDCRLRVDVWTPREDSMPLTRFRVSRTVFGESDQNRNTALYGRPLTTADYFVLASAPGRATIDNGTPFRLTTFGYDFDGPRDPVNLAIGTGSGFNHNTRETSRTTTVGSRTSTIAYLDWDGLGHWRTTVKRENSGSGDVELRRAEETHLNLISDSVAGCRWILEPVTSRTVSRPFIAGSDASPANLSTTENFDYDGDGFLVSKRVSTADQWSGYSDTRVRTTTFSRGAASSAPCLYGGPSRPECANRGFPTQQVETLTGSLNGVAANSSFARSFFYKYGTASASYDSGADFYALDRDVSPTGKILAERPSAGRQSLADSAPVLSTTLEYDLLGRIVRTTPPEEYATEVTYSTRFLTRTRRDSAGSMVSQGRVFFDDLGRPTVELRQLPGGTFSYRVSTFDPAGHSIGISEWASIACVTANPCPELDRLQAYVDPATHVSSPSGIVSWGFDEVDRPAYVRQADGSLQSHAYAGWWQQTTTRTVNVGGSAIPSAYSYERDALGQLTKVVEPATSKAGGTVMNSAETTTYRYDHMGRLTRSVKTGSDSYGQLPVSQVRTTLWDDFGWVSTQTGPEVPSLKILARDARGNPTREVEGATTIIRGYDPAGRPTTAYNAMDPSYPFLQLFYDKMPASTGYGGNMGRANGRLVYSIRMNHTSTSHFSPSSPDVPVDFGWIGVQDLYHYTGLGGRLGFRQIQTMLIDGPPASPSLTALAKPPTKGKSLKDAFRDYFVSAKRSLKDKDSSLAAILPVSPGDRSMAATVLGSPSTPDGWIRWSYEYDPAGRMSKLTYPRRNEGYPTEATYTYDSGLPTRVNVTFSDPFTAGPVETAEASIGYNPSGIVASTSISSGASTSVFRLTTPDDPSGMPRAASWNLTRQPGQIGVESRPYAYDPSGNLATIGGASYLYDSRSRLVKDSLPGRSLNPYTFEYDGFGNMTAVRNDIRSTTFTVDRATNRVTGPGTMRWDAAGRLGYDGTRLLQRDYYPDGLVMTEYQHNGDYMLLGSGISGWLFDGSGERAMSYWGREGSCDTQLFLHTPRDEQGRVLTEYRGEPAPGCTCAAACTYYDRYQKDYVWAGNGLLTWTRGTGSRFSALNHLGSPEYVFDRSGNVAAQLKLDSWGQDLGTAGLADRHRYTSHERDHVTTLDGPTLPIADHMHARTYVPMLGRLTRPDPARSFSLFDPQSLNRYAYARNNPLKYVDPNGKSPALAAIARQAGIGAAVGMGVRVGLNLLIRTVNPGYDVKTGVLGSTVQGAITGGMSARTTLAKYGANVLGSMVGATITGLEAGHTTPRQLGTDALNGVATGIGAGALDSAASVGVEKLMAQAGPAATEAVEAAFKGVVAGTTSIVQEAINGSLDLMDEVRRAYQSDQPIVRTTPSEEDELRREWGR